eukprot:4782179-Pyramimonas_sp.AAC.1
MHPKELIDQKIQTWTDLWAPHTVDYHCLHAAFQRIIDRIQECPLPALTADDLRRAASRLKANTALGVDRLRPGDFQRLPQDALQELADLLTTSERLQAWPHQLLHTIG